MSDHPHAARCPYARYRRSDGTWRPPRAEGLARILAKAGYGARPRAAQLVQAGRVAVAGKVVRDPARAVEPDLAITLDGEPLREAPRLYLALHKPRGVDCQERPHAGRWIGDLLPPEAVGLEPAGRLDPRARGLMLVSNDLWWNARVAEATDLERRYQIVVRGSIDRMALDLVRTGVSLPSQGTVRPLWVQVRQETGRQTTVEVAVRGGHHRQIRTVFTTLRYEVLSMVRSGFGPLDLEALAPGASRPLTPVEVQQLARGGSHG